MYAIADADKLDQITKYPSIPTYHKLGQRGRLLSEIETPLEGELIVTEKVNGANARIVLFPENIRFSGRFLSDTDYFLGARDEFLTAKGDLFYIKTCSIVDTIKPIAERLPAPPPNTLIVIFGEVFGKATATAEGKNYSTKQSGFRMFDVLCFNNLRDWLDQTNDHISWRKEHGEQPFLNEKQLQLQSEIYGIPLTPRINLVNKLPTGIEETYEFLKQTISQTRCALDETAKLLPEGIVVRTADRKQIAKVRFEEYRRTIEHPL